MQQTPTALKVVYKDKVTENTLLEQQFFTAMLSEELTHLITLLEKEFTKDEHRKLAE